MQADRLDQWTRVLCLLFFSSGFPALIYQLTWQRALFRIFGVNIESVTIVVAAFMLGLGLGSLAGGWVSRRRSIPLLPLLAVIELMIGAFGLASMTIFDNVGEFMIGLPLAATAAAALTLVIVPTLLMGATLPILVGHLVRRSGNVGNSIGLLYYVNTLGAGAACLVCAALLFPFLGMQGAIYVAVAINCVVAFGALVAHWCDSRFPSFAAQDRQAAPATGGPSLGFASVLALAAVGGFVSLSYEIFFFRTVSYATGSSATAFAMTLAAFLVGLAGGARRSGHDCATLPRDALMSRAVMALVKANILGLLFLPLLDQMAWLGAAIVGIAILLVYLIARYWGSLLPFLAELGIAANDQAGMRTAILYLANILGAAAGSVLTGFVLMNHLGLVSLATILTVSGFICTLLLVCTLRTPRPEKIVRASIASALCALAVIVVPRWSATALESLQWKGQPNVPHLAQFVENRSGIIAVTEDGTVLGNGMYDGQFNISLKNDTNGIVRPYALSLFHPAPRDVLVIGLASGSWSQVIANNPEVASVTVVEINSGYQTLIAREPEVASLLTNPKVTLVTDDGRRWLRANSNRRFDAIVANATHHFRANATNLLSAEFLNLIRGHLNPGGVFFYNTTSSDRVQRTGCLAFAHGARFTNHLLVSDMPIRWDFARWRRILESYRIDGRPTFDSTASEDRAELDRLASFEASLTASGTERAIEPCPNILARTVGKRPVTDDNMGAEWRHFLGLE